MNEQALLEKIKDIGIHYVAQQVDTNIDELEEHGFTDEEIDFLNDKGLPYIETLIRQEYEPFTDLKPFEIKAIKDGMKVYEIYGLINDWSLGINDFPYDEVMLKYLANKKYQRERRRDTAGGHHLLYARLYRTLLEIKDKELDTTKKLFNKSVENARRAGVIEEKILKTKDDIDNYFA